MAAAVVDAAQAAAGRLVLVEEGGGRAVEGVGEHLSACVARRLREVLEADRQREELAQAVPAQVVLLEQLLDMLGRGAAGARLEQAAAVHERDDREHLGTRAKLQDREQVGQVVAQHVAGDRDRVLAPTDPLQGERDRVRRRHDLNLESPGIVLRQVGPDFLDQFRVMRTVLIEPEHRWVAGGTGTGDGELHPVPDRRVLGLAQTDDVASADHLLQEHGAGRVDGPYRARGGNLEGLVVAAVLLGLLCHQADVGHRAHRRGVEGAVRPAVIDDNLVDAGIAAVGKNREGVRLLAVRTPHVTGGTDHSRHGGVHDDIAGHMQVGDAAVGVDHRQGGAVGQLGGEGSLDSFAFGQGFQALEDATEPVVRSQPCRGKRLTVGGEGPREKGPHHVAENDRVGNLHHRGLQVYGEQHALGLGTGDLCHQELTQRGHAHDGGVHDLARQHRYGLTQDDGSAVLTQQLDAQRAGFGDDCGLLRGTEVVSAHGGNVRLRIGAPRAHPVRVGPSVAFHRRGSAAVGVALA